MLIIGIAVGVVVLGMEKIDFFWYLMEVAWLVFAGFLAGSLAFMLIRNFVLNT